MHCLDLPARAETVIAKGTMDYNSPLIDGQFLKRYKRFFADVKLGNEIVVAHVPNTGSLKSVCDKERPCRLSPSTNPERKLKFTLEQVKTDTSWVGVNTHKANELGWEAFQLKLVPHWQNYKDAVREVKISKETRLDMKLIGNKEHFVEIKSVTLAKDGVAMFPDAETTRGQKHLDELVRLVQEGAEAELLFVVQRTDCDRFAPADDIDPVYGQKLRQAIAAGVKVSAYPVEISATRIQINTQKPLLLLV